MKVNILGVQVDKISHSDALGTILKWLKGSGRYYVVTPNVEMIVEAQKDREFRKILNQADLAIPDSGRLGWAYHQLKAKSGTEKMGHLLGFLSTKSYSDFPITTGTDLTEELIQKAAEQGFVIGFIGGSEEVALKLVERLKKRYPKLKIACSEPNIQVDGDGNQTTEFSQLDQIEIAIDILFVALGHKKQEKWIVKNRHKINAKVMIGIGGALDYLSGSVVRAPKMVRNFGFEWLFRLIVQPWRAKRFLSLFEFLLLIMKSPVNL